MAAGITNLDKKPWKIEIYKDNKYQPVTIRPGERYCTSTEIKARSSGQEMVIKPHEEFIIDQSGSISLQEEAVYK